MSKNRCPVAVILYNMENGRGEGLKGKGPMTGDVWALWCQYDPRARDQCRRDPGQKSALLCQML